MFITCKNTRIILIIILISISIISIIIPSIMLYHTQRYYDDNCNITNTENHCYEVYCPRYNDTNAICDISIINDINIHAEYIIYDGFIGFSAIGKYISIRSGLYTYIISNNNYSFYNAGLSVFIILGSF